MATHGLRRGLPSFAAPWLEYLMVSDPAFAGRSRTAKVKTTGAALGGQPMGGCPHMSFAAGLGLRSEVESPRSDDGSRIEKAESRLHFVQRSTQSLTVLYQSCEFCGLSTQWPSSGK